MVELGYQVHQAADGFAAMALLAAPDAPVIDLVVTDVLMPRVGGPALAEQLDARWPDIAVLFVSGFTRDEVQERDLRRGCRAFLQKPFTPSELAVSLRQILDRRTRPA